MTRQKHLKDLVRARMHKTGESYSAARRHIITQVSPKQSAAQFPWHFPGSIPAAAGLRVLLANAGITSPHTQQPLTEAMVFGIAGGIGAGVFAFHYAKENFSSFYIAGRHLWQDDLAYAKGLCARLGLAATVKESTGAKGAAKQLEEALETGPVLAWVDAAHLPYRAMPAMWSGGGYHVLVIFRVDTARGTALLGDLADEPVEISLEALADARARIKKQKHRILTITPDGRTFDLKKSVREGLRACVQAMAGAKMRNFSLEAFKTWGDRLHGTSSKDSWETIFPPGRLLWDGLISIHSFIEYYGTGGGLTRPIYAEFFAEAARALDDPRLGALGERYAELGRGWSALADAALPSDVPAFREAKALLARKAELQLSGGNATVEIGETWRRLGELAATAGDRFPLSAADADRLRHDLKARVLTLYEGEVDAQKELAAVAG